MGDRSKTLVIRSKQPYTEICLGRISSENLLRAIYILRHSKIDFVCARRLVSLKIVKYELITGSLRAHFLQVTVMFRCNNLPTAGKAFVSNTTVQISRTISFKDNSATFSTLVNL